MYESTCKECVDAKGEPTVKYVGETSRSGSERWGNHMRDARNKVNDSHIYSTTGRVNMLAERQNSSSR